MSKIFAHPLYRVLIAIFCCALWGSAFPTLKVSYRELNILPGDAGALLVFAGCRFLLASLILLGTAGITRRIKKTAFPVPSRRDWPVFLLIGLFQTALQYLFFYTGLVRTLGTIGSVVNSSGVFFTVILASLVFRNDRMTWVKAMGIVLGISGIIIVNGGISGVRGGFSLGVLLLIAASFTGAAGGIFVKYFSSGRSPLVLTGWQMFLGSLILLSAGLILPLESAVTFTGRALVLYIYSALLSATAFVLWNYLLKYNKAGEIGFFRFSIPLFGTLLSALFLSEPVTARIIVPLFLVAGGILMVTLNSSRG